MHHLVLVAVLGVLAGPLAAQTEHTLRLDDGQSSPPASLADAALLAGHWQGSGLGGFNELVWTEPRGGTMQGMYQLIRNDSTVFYQLLQIVERDGSLVLNLKHFHPDLTAWEEKDEMVSFRLVRIEPEEAVYFEGLTYVREGADRMRVYLTFYNDDGPYEVTFDLHEVGP